MIIILEEDIQFDKLNRNEFSDVLTISSVGWSWRSRNAAFLGLMMV